ncbi:MAG: peptidoglycan-associated lipoprotein Pal [Proteobacteria bacterium]|nr:peptidoglycan-associated lipoprotein Pal [Pseudomonadota bacterium]
MKLKRFTSGLITTLALVLVVGACSKKKVGEEQEGASDITSFDGKNGGSGTKIPELDTVYFEYDSFALTAGSKKALAAAADWIKANATIQVQVEGHCDERGTTEYNLALGERRAGSVKDYLIGKGVPSAQLSTISYGEERPSVSGSDESAWAKNRRAEFVSVGK